MRTCADCGEEFPERVGKGRPFSRCERCRVRPRRASTARRVRESFCSDCGAAFSVTRTEDVKLLRGPTRCPECRAKTLREREYRWREANPEKWKAVQARASTKRLANPEHRRNKRENEMRRIYGMEPGDFQRLLDSQDGKCAICGYVPPTGGDSLPLPRGQASTRLHVDHCHTNGHVRGLLCGKCNTMIGLANDDPAVLAAAIEYLKKE